jgi:hypothetical protein
MTLRTAYSASADLRRTAALPPFSCPVKDGHENTKRARASSRFPSRSHDVVITSQHLSVGFCASSSNSTLVAFHCPVKEGHENTKTRNAPTPRCSSRSHERRHHTQHLLVGFCRSPSNRSLSLFIAPHRNATKTRKRETGTRPLLDFLYDATNVVMTLRTAYSASADVRRTAVLSPFACKGTPRKHENTKN